MDGNFAALLPTNPIFLAWKHLSKPPLNVSVLEEDYIIGGTPVNINICVVQSIIILARK